jgi:exonuclease III
VLAYAVLLRWLAESKPDVACLRELKMELDLFFIIWNLASVVVNSSVPMAVGFW